VRRYGLTARKTNAAGADVRHLLAEGRALLRDRHDIAHATLQVEPATGEACLDTGW
jgi:cobalt-zinc-cadmium efflux system protein